MHNDIKAVQQILTDDVHSANDASNKDVSSILGKYITGAKNNFRGFHNGQEDKHSPLKVTVHHREEGEDKEQVDCHQTQESGVKQNQGAEGGTEGSDCEVVRMEEGRAKAAANKKDENKEQVDAGINKNTACEVKEVQMAKASSDDVEDMIKSEGTQNEATKRQKVEIVTAAEDGEKHTETEHPDSTNESTDMKSVVNMFKDTELQEKKVEAKWRKGRKFEHNGTERADVKESNEKPGTDKTISSPTGSSSSQDTGFGSREGESSIDGIVMRT